MALECGSMADLSLSCTEAASAGMYGDIWIYNKKDWDVSTVTKTAGVITAIENAVDVEAYKVSLQDGMPSATFTPAVNDAGRVMYTHSLRFMIDNRGQTGKNVFEALSTGLFVAIARVKGGAAADSFQVLGENVGMRNETGGFDSTANSGMIEVVLTTPTTPNAEYETEAPSNFWITDLSTTLAALAALEVVGA